jgi:transposase
MKQKSYSKEFKESVIKRMMPPNSVSVSQLCKETGVSDVTLYKWRKDYKNRGIAVPGDHSKPENWAAEDKLAVIIETACLFNCRPISLNDLPCDHSCHIVSC